LELAGIGPGPLAACVLADFGADVITIVRVSRNKKGEAVVDSEPSTLGRGKRSIAIDLKAKEGIEAVKKLAKQSDVFIEPFRPGTVEKLGIGPEDLMAVNPRLIYGRMTGWGQGGDPKVSLSAGHDSNYLALSGALSLFVGHGREGMPMPPINFAGDYAGGAMMLVMGVLLSLLERQRSNKGQVIDAAMVDGANYVALPVFKWLQSGFVPTNDQGFPDARSSILNQASHFGNVYRCKDGKFVTVQALEPQFYKILLKGMGLKEDELPPRADISQWPKLIERFQQIFETKTRDEWGAIFYGTDACVAPVLSAEEAAANPHNVKRGTFAPTPGEAGQFEPAPAPKLSRTPGSAPRPAPKPAQHTVEVLLATGFSEEEVAALLAQGAVVGTPGAKL